MKKVVFKGAATALITPFKDGKIDFDAYGKIIDYQIEQGIDAIVSCGTVLSKYTGARGKSGTSDASAEFVGFVRRLFDENGVIWQTAELGKVDAGGGGTVAMFIANHNIETVDLGVPVISMHAPYEVVSKADVYSTYEACVAFVK